MNFLPVNNFDEQFARFSASKKPVSVNSNGYVDKKFTFKKSLSLEKQKISKSSSDLKLLEKKDVLEYKNASNEKKYGQAYESDSFKKITSKHSDLHNIIILADEKKKNSIDIRDYFFSDESDFEIPANQAGPSQKNKSPQHQNSLSILNKTKGNVFPKPIEILKSNINKEKMSSSKAVDEKVQKFPVPDFLNNKVQVNSFISKNKFEEQFSEGLSVVKEVSNDSKNFFDDENLNSSFIQKFLKESHCSDLNSLPALQKLNVEIMSRICDIIEAENNILLRNKDLSSLINFRKQILQKCCFIGKDSHYLQNIPNLTHSKENNSGFCNEENEIKPKGLMKNDLMHLSKSSWLKESSENKELQKTSFSNTTEIPLFQGKHCASNVQLPTSRCVSSSINSIKNSFQTFSSAQMKETSLFTDKSVDNFYDEDLCESNDFGLSEDFSELIDPPSKTQEKMRNFMVINSTQPFLQEGRTIIAGKFYGNQRDDGASPQYKGFGFPFSKDVQRIFRNVFGLKNFRHNQLEAINAALLKEDCFVLMPTGGGKSLCYQLPAMVASGVTIVISPLRSLIMDQVQKLCSLDIPANCLTGDTDSSTMNYVYSQLSVREPSIKLLYVTPEKISASPKLFSSFESLYSRNMLQRFIIDEAHCVSQWGHDFRPDYKRLKVLREKLPNVPLMALTATATPRVRGDILHQLGMKSPKWFLQSFNRPNLKYEVKDKTKGILAEIVDLLKSKFRDMCGIIYCLSRKDCDNVAAFLVKGGIKAAAYHAGMNNREEVQEQWINDRFKVICATIAFGMGIDKPDVRFVIHHAIPKSIEGYYQESGRAGRDGEYSWCILYYSYKDMQRIRRMIMQDLANKHFWSTHFDNLFKMVHYCENKTDCRRVWMLEYFGEIFDRSLCSSNPQTACDNCYSKEIFEEHDMTEDAKCIVQCVSELVDKRKRQNYTLTYFVDIYKGAKTQKILTAGHQRLSLYGKGQSLRRSDAERLMRKLVLDQYLQEHIVINRMGLPISYVCVGKKAKDLLSGRVKIILQFQKSKGKTPQNAASVEDPEILELIERCYNELIEVSKAIAIERNMHYTNVVNVEALRQMSREMPMTEEDMLAIPHITQAVYEKYGRRFLEVTAKFGAERCVMDAEKADREMMSACAEDIESWSDIESFDDLGTTVKKGTKRKASKSIVGQAQKKQKNFFSRRKRQRNRVKPSTSKKKIQNKPSAVKVKPSAVKVPGFLPNPARRSFLPHPVIVLN